jgi:hypothetical protein
VPPTSVHFNGSVNLGDAETVMREIAARVPYGVRRIPDGETGDRLQWTSSCPRPWVRRWPNGASAPSAGWVAPNATRCRVCWTSTATSWPGIAGRWAAPGHEVRGSRPRGDEMPAEGLRG